MPQIPYLLVERKILQVYEIRGVCTSPDIPDSLKVRALIDCAAAATHDLMCLNSDQEALIEPVGDFRDRSAEDIANELGSVDERFFRRKVLRLPPTKRMSELNADVCAGKIIVVFSVCPPIDQPRVDVAELALTWSSNRRRDDVPEIHELRDILAAPLVDSEKVPITMRMFQSLVSVDRADDCSETDVFSLFTIGEPDLSFHAIFTAVLDPVPARGTKASFIPKWANNITKLLRLMIPSVEICEDPSHHMAMQKSYPDLHFLVDGFCVLQLQGRGSWNTEDLNTTSSNNFIWTYGSAPYVLGYYCHGRTMTLVAITAPRTRNGEPQLHDIITVDLGLRKDRLANVRYLINLAPILLAMASVFPR
ncbi:hypothetical protein EDC04DRAFT_2900184 [Pisolithus marmoratus]|nr:hypothetical protein EDC04DRAFT_2900184 [Pisolithus marmoratus]